MLVCHLLMSLCPVSLSSCVDNYVVFYVLSQCFMFLCLVSVCHTFDVFVSCVIVVLC